MAQSSRALLQQELTHLLASNIYPFASASVTAAIWCRRAVSRPMRHAPHGGHDDDDDAADDDCGVRSGCSALYQSHEIWFTPTGGRFNKLRVARG